MASTAPVLNERAALDALPERLRASVEPYLDRLVLAPAEKLPFDDGEFDAGFRPTGGFRVSARLPIPERA